MKKKHFNSNILNYSSKRIASWTVQIVFISIEGNMFTIWRESNTSTKAPIYQSKTFSLCWWCFCVGELLTAGCDNIRKHACVLDCIPVSSQLEGFKFNVFWSVFLRSAFSYVSVCVFGKIRRNILAICLQSKLQLTHWNYGVYVSNSKITQVNCYVCK